MNNILQASKSEGPKKSHPAPGTPLDGGASVAPPLVLKCPCFTAIRTPNIRLFVERM